MASQVPQGPSCSMVHGSVISLWNTNVMAKSERHISIVCTACSICPKIMPGEHIRTFWNLTFSGWNLPSIRANLSLMQNSVLDVFDNFLDQAYCKCYRDASSHLWQKKPFQLHGLPCPRLVAWVTQSPRRKFICMLWMHQACFTQIMSSMTNNKIRSLAIHAILVHSINKTCLQHFWKSAQISSKGFS